MLDKWFPPGIAVACLMRRRSLSLRLVPPLPLSLLSSSHTSWSSRPSLLQQVYYWVYDFVPHLVANAIGVCEKNTPPEKNARWNISFQSTKSGAGEQFLLSSHKKECFFTDTGIRLSCYHNQCNRSPRPQLEPQITSLEKCNLNLTIFETPNYIISWVGVGGSCSVGDIRLSCCCYRDRIVK